MAARSMKRLSSDEELSDSKKGRGKRSRYSGSCTTITDLFDSILIHEILLKLPTETIIQCRHVCESWYQLISGPGFTDMYLNTAPPLTSIAISDYKSVGFLEIGKDGGITRRPFKSEFNLGTIIGSCDGLLCFVETPFYEQSCSVRIVNPCTEEYIALPKIHEVKYVRAVYGFGSTAEADRYKVVRFSMLSTRRLGGAHILTIGVDAKWRDLDKSSMPLSFYPDGIALNGVLHWIGNDVIYALDIGTEKGKNFTIPVEVKPWKMHAISLGVWDGCLCITDNTNMSQFDIWTMKQYGIAESWSRDVIVRNNDVRNNARPLFYPLRPITMLSNGDLLISDSDNRRLKSFDPKTKKCVELEVSNLVHFDSSLSGYTRSFVSPSGRTSKLKSSIHS